MPETIPDKLYFKIGEVARIAEVKPYVLRYWETEFKLLTPIKSRSGQRLYRRRDVDLILRIKELLYAERFTIEGARRKIREEEVPSPDSPEAGDRRGTLMEMRKEVLELIKLTARQPPVPLSGPPDESAEKVAERTTTV